VFIFKDQAVQDLKMVPIGSPETSDSKFLTLRNIPEDGRIRFNRDGSLISRLNWKLITEGVSHGSSVSTVTILHTECLRIFYSCFWAHLASNSRVSDKGLSALG
jgi:hypothetical protein